MKVILRVIPVLVLFAVVSSAAHALPFYDENFYFYGTANGGTASAEMNVTITEQDSNQYRLIATLNNTSPDYPDDPDYHGTFYSPAITGFGFDIDFGNPEPDPLPAPDWYLSALKKEGDSFSTVGIGGSNDPDSDPEHADDWDLSVLEYNNNDKALPSWMGFKVDYIPHVDNGLEGALYNQIAQGPGGNTWYYTTATLTMDFDQPIYGLVINVTDVNYYSPFVRFQRVGENGAGSLKLEDPTAVPEPATLFLLGSGFIGLALRQRSLKA